MAHALSAAVNSTGWSHNHSDNSLKHFLKLARNTTVLYRTRVNPLSFSQCWFHGLFEYQDWTEKSKKRESVVVFLWEKPLSVVFSSIRDEFNKTFASVIYKCSFCFRTLKTIATLVAYTCRSIIELTPGVFTFWSEKSFCYAGMNFTDSVTILQANWFRVASLARWARLRITLPSHNHVSTKNQRRSVVLWALATSAKEKLVPNTFKMSGKKLLFYSFIERVTKSNGRVVGVWFVNRD